MKIILSAKLAFRQKWHSHRNKEQTSVHLEYWNWYIAALQVLLTHLLCRGFGSLSILCMIFSGMTVAYFLKQRNDAPRAVKKYLAYMKPYGSVVCLRTDQAKEFIGGEFKATGGNLHQAWKISTIFSASNGPAERSWRTLFTVVRCNLLKSDLPRALWVYAVSSAAYTRNLCYAEAEKNNIWSIQR